MVKVASAAAQLQKSRRDFEPHTTAIIRALKRQDAWLSRATAAAAQQQQQQHARGS